MDEVETPSERARRSLELELFGQRLTVVSDSDPALVREVVDFVNRRMEQIRDGAPRAGADQVALLAALNIAEELFEERRRRDALKRTVRERSRTLLGAIDRLSRQAEGRELEAP
ncbi:MAG: cell division protein ZapA [Myxococcales bacterium]|nr:cell division protein ZapA [Myxococcales bacterium]MCB9645871.1 cell division protein ZapA [Deltaproteobacteria bacterium]